jgi:hypothetical protein
MQYKKPTVSQGREIEVYACNGGTCNGKNNSMLNIIEDEDKKIKEVA